MSSQQRLLFAAVVGFALAAVAKAGFSSSTFQISHGLFTAEFKRKDAKGRFGLAGAIDSAGRVYLSDASVVLHNIKPSILTHADELPDDVAENSKDFWHEGLQTLGMTLPPTHKAAEPVAEAKEAGFEADIPMLGNFQMLDVLFGSSEGERQRFLKGMASSGNEALFGLASSSSSKLDPFTQQRKRTTSETEAHEGDGVPVPKIELQATLKFSGPAALMKAKAAEATTSGVVDIEIPHLHPLVLSVTFEPNKEQKLFGLKKFQMNVEFSVTRFDFVVLPKFELDIPRFYIWKKLKLQPWGLKRHSYRICVQLQCFPQSPFLPFVPGSCPARCVQWLWVPDLAPTGPAGLAFGQPMADELWAQAGIQLEWAELKYIYRDDLKVCDTTPAGSSEYDELMDFGANDDEYVDVYFAREFAPSHTAKGGGATRASGSANARITTTEKMIEEGVDITHVAHEIGHAVNLDHPGQPFGLAASSEGTLMCASGYGKDNPRVQSQENADNAASPLFQYIIRTTPPPSPECEGDDCGECCKWCPGNDQCIDC
eukprot:m.15998 g.15998  ORF g.15998 m.15998 type:complete len:542 (-) comp5135_c0_seq1:187-1812(-)